MKITVMRTMTTVCLLFLAVYGSSAIAADSKETKLSPDDFQAIFDLLFYRKCQGLLKPTLEITFKEFPQIAVDENVEKDICRCTANMVSTGYRMREIYKMPPEKLKQISSNAEASSYIKNKAALSMLQCIAFHVDALIDPKPKAE